MEQQGLHEGSMVIEGPDQPLRECKLRTKKKRNKKEGAMQR